jgi:4-hydroxythreonine-4-phosphate dehydrogenase
VVLGAVEVLEKAAEFAPGVKLREVNAIEGAGEEPGCVDILPVGLPAGSLIRPGEPTLEGGKAMMEAVVAAVEAALKGDLAAVVTCPINKALMKRSGWDFDGHTELLSHLTGADEVAMMLAGMRLRVVLATVHCALAEVPRILTKEKILKAIRLAHRALLSDFGIVHPRLAVAALNPHGGEEGLFGSEEKQVIEPAVKEARSMGIDAIGPLPADTVFYKAAAGGFDAVVSMYHDQGLIPLKLLHFTDGVNVTLGLPIIRTSVDHGTAYDIAGKGGADPASLEAAVRMAASMAAHRKKRRRT